MKREYGKGDQILTAAYNIFGERGFHLTKMEDVAKEANVAKGTLYLYYANKEEMFRAVVEKIFTDYIQAFERILSRDIPLKEKLTDLVCHHLTFIRDRRHFASVLREAGLTDELRTLCGDLVGRVQAQFVASIRQYLPRESSEHRVSLSFLCFVGMADGMISDMVWSDGALSDEEIAERAAFVAEMFVNGLRLD